jgi:hypothetical protein
MTEAQAQAVKIDAPRLNAAEREEYARIEARLSRAKADLRRATKRGDATKIAAAERAINKASTAHDAFVYPRVAHLRASAPQRVIARFEGRWRGTSGHGAHVQVCEMVLDHLDLSGPSYRTVRVVSDVGGPPTGARSAPDVMGVAWFAIADQIARGHMTPIDEGESRNPMTTGGKI